MSDGSCVVASVKTSGLWCCMEKKLAQEHLLLRAGQCPTNIHSCLLRCCPSICHYLLIESQVTEGMRKFLRESAYMSIL